MFKAFKIIVINTAVLYIIRIKKKKTRSTAKSYSNKCFVFIFSF